MNYILDNIGKGKKIKSLNDKQSKGKGNGGTRKHTQKAENSKSMLGPTSFAVHSD